MSRRKNRSRHHASPAPTRGRAPNQRVDFSNFLQQLLADMPGRVQTGSVSPRQADPLEKWFDELDELMDVVPEDMHHELLSGGHNLTYQIHGLYQEGMVWAKIQDGEDVHNVYVNFSNDRQPMGCTCARSRGQGACVHTAALLVELMGELEERYSSLSTRIRTGKFDKQKPDPAIFRFDPDARIKLLLESLLPTGDLGLLETAEAEPELPPVDETPPTRLVWNVLLKGHNLELTPTLQQAKKRGDGWTKGRKVSMESLHEHLSIMSEVDRQVRDLIKADTNYYRVIYHLDGIQALARLVAAPNVLLNGEPAEVKWAAPALQWRSSSEGIRLEIAHTAPGSSTFVFGLRNLVHVRTDVPVIEVVQATAEQIQALKKICRMPWIANQYQPQLVETARRLQPLLNVSLPESVAGKQVQEDYQPALLLRSRSDGGLDYGIRLRNSAGQLILPGRGQIVRSAQRGDETVQMVRSVDREFDISRQLAQRFGLPANELHGTLHDFETVLQLLEKLHQAEIEGSIETLWDKQSQKPLRILGSVTPQNVSVGISRRRDWFQLQGSCALDSGEVELSELLDGLQAAGGDAVCGEYVRLGDRGWARVSRKFRDQLRSLHDAVNLERGTMKLDATAAPAIRDLMAQQVQLNSTAAWTQCLQRLENAEHLDPQLPQNLQADLRDYQTEGYKWLRRLAEWGVGGVLADDMGLGKTLQTLAVVLDRAAAGPSLVIAPTSVGFNWVREAQRFTPDLDVHLYRETQRADFLQDVGPRSLVVCSYGLALRDAKALAGVHWTSLVLDEAQAIKNSRSKTSTAVATIPADWKVALTGTPVENHLGELWSLFHVISPGVLGGWEQFRRRFAGPIEKDNDPQRQLALRQRLRPFLLRRTKDEVLKDLPPRSEMNMYIELSPEERSIYDKVRLSSIGEIDQLAKLGDVNDQRFRILALLTRMRQLACSPQLVHEDWKHRSSKLQQLCETLHELRDEGHRVLVFSQFVKHLSLIRAMLDEEQISYEYLDGSTDAKTRQERVDSFQNGTATAFLISLKAGGTGLNLTAADYVIHMDPWWNPAVEDQATDRAHRIGQDKPVMVYRMIAQGTIEEEILKLHDSKRDLVAGIMDGAQAAAKLTTEDLMALLRQ